MSRHVTPPKQPPGRGPNGRPFCCWCGAEVPKGARSWCSQTCVDAYLLTTWPGGKAAAEQRDQGVCARCRLDTGATGRAFIAWCEARCGALGVPTHYGLSVSGWRYRLPLPVKRDAVEWMAFHGIPADRWERAWYDVDHILPVADGGTNHPDNLRTLCVRCHRTITAEWRRARAARPRPQHAPAGRREAST